MQNSKLYSILEYFDKYEQNRLRKFITSPYFNKNEAIIKLFDSLIAHVNAKKPEEIEKEILWEQIYKNAEYDDVLFRKNCSDLLKLVEAFLTQQVFDKDHIGKTNYLFKAISKKKIEKLFNSTTLKSQRHTKNQILRDSDFYLKQYQLEKSYYEITQNNIRRSKKSNVENILSNLDKFFFAEKLRWYTSVLTQQYLISHEYKLLFVDEILEYLETNKFSDTPAVEIYFQIYLTLKEPENESHYYKLKSLLSENGLRFNKDEAKSIYYSAINYCIRKSNIEGKKNFLVELLDIYKDLINKEILIDDVEGLSPWDFKNVITCATSTGEFEWAEKFIKKYGKLIPSQFRENAISFNTAQLFFYQKKYRELISLLQKVEYEDFSYNLNSKLFLLMTYYELDEIEPLYSLLDSFRSYLNRHKDFPKERRELYGNLIKFTKKLTKINYGSKKDIEKIKKEIDNTERVASVKWLKEKIDELEKR